MVLLTPQVRSLHNIIQQIPISKSGGVDKLIRVVTKKGTFSVRSTYHLAIQLKQTVKGETSRGKEEEDFWLKSWQLQILGKVKNFIWPALKNILPTRFNLLSKKIKCKRLCLICKQEERTVIHMLCNCPASSDVWSNSSTRFKNG